MNTESRINQILKKAVEMDASDIHLKVGVSPMFRVHRELHIETSFPPLTAEDTAGYFKEIASVDQQQAFYKNWELDMSYSVPGMGRFRVNTYLQVGTVSLVFRWVRNAVPEIEDLGLPEVCKDLAMRRDGLIILTGPTGCGKSTTLAAMLNYMNHLVKRNIITVEDPIEFLHTDDKCTFSQREVGIDTRSFADSLRHVFRQDPDVILVGEMRDRETMAIALTAAETGHLVLTTLHTPSAYEAIDRFIDAFPPEQHQQVRLQLSTTLQGVMYQNLIPKADGTGVVPAVEVLIATSAIRNLIREGKTYQMLNYMQAGHADGMQTIDHAIKDLVRDRKITPQEGDARLRGIENLKTESAKTPAKPKIISHT